MVEVEEGVGTNKLAQVRFLLLLGPERTDVEFFVELILEGEAPPPASWRASQVVLAMVVLSSTDIMSPANAITMLEDIRYSGWK